MLSKSRLTHKKTPGDFARRLCLCSCLLSGLSHDSEGRAFAARAYNKGTISKATMLMILMSGFTAGPAVSL